jgi:hypothetical protein
MIDKKTLNEEIAIAIAERTRLQNLIDEAENNIAVLQAKWFEYKKSYETESDNLVNKRTQLRDRQIDAKHAVDEKIALAENRYESYM